MNEKEFDDFFKKSLSEMEEVCNKHLEKEELDIDKWGEDLFNIDSLKELNEYLKSEENLKKCEPFEKLHQKFISLHDRNKDSFDDLYKGIEEKTCRREYSKGGLGFLGFHRGFYSPSQLDLVVRGVNRGRLLKRGKNGKESYEYLFDKDNELICVYFYGNHNIIPSVELFVRNNDVVQSFYFVRIPGHKGLRFITEVIKENGKIIEYRWAMFNEYNGKNECDEITVEKYDYKDDRIQSFHYYEYYPRPKRPMLNHDKFTLFWDENGKIQSVKTEYLY